MYAIGYKPSPSSKVGLGPPNHLFGAVAIPDVASVRKYVIEVVDQLSSSSCVANAIAQQARTAMVIQGVKAPELPSRLFVYYGARALNGDQGVDGGTFIHSAYEAMEAIGFPPESAWTFTDDQAKICTQPDWAALRAAADQRWLDGHYRILKTGLDRIYDVKAALAANHAVAWGTQVDQAFMDLTPGKVWPGLTGPSIGGHATLIVGYTPDYFEVCNSWGPGWCDAGFYRVSYAAVASPNATDFWVATVAPKFSGVA